MSAELKYKIVEDAPHLLRDPYSKGIINSDSEALNKYKEARRKLNDIRLLSIEQTLIKKEQNELKQDIEEIKNLLYKLLENTNK